MEQSTFQPGDICLECQQQGLSNRLRTFYIDINEQIVKCESSSCIYPFINDFSDSEEDILSESFQKSPPNPTSLPSSDSCFHPNNDFDELDSVRFVESLLSIDGKNNAALQNHIEMLPSTSSLKSNTSQPHSFFKDASDVKEGVNFIDKLFSNCKTDASSALNTTSLTAQETSATFDVPVIGFDLAGIPPTAEHCLLDVKKESKPHIEIQCIQTVKAEFANTNNVANSVANESKISISSMEFIKTEYIKEEPAITADATENSSATSQANVSTGGTRISRYFDALRVKQEKLQKSQSKHISVDRKNRSCGPLQQTKSDTATRGSLTNVLQVLKTKGKK